MVYSIYDYQSTKKKRITRNKTLPISKTKAKWCYTMSVGIGNVHWQLQFSARFLHKTFFFSFFGSNSECEHEHKHEHEHERGRVL